MKFYPCEKGVGKCFSHTEGAQNVLEFFFFAILKVGAKVSTLLRGGGALKILPCLEGRLEKFRTNGFSILYPPPPPPPSITNDGYITTHVTRISKSTR